MEKRLRIQNVRGSKNKRNAFDVLKSPKETVENKKWLMDVNGTNIFKSNLMLLNNDKTVGICV